MLAALRRSGKTLAQLLEGVKLFPQTLINVRVETGFDWQSNHAGLQAMRAKVERELEGRGRVLIRASGTEPVVRVMVEAATPTRRSAAPNAWRTPSAAG